MMDTKELKDLSMPKISIIIPVYNVEKNLRECLDSALAQTLQDIEIIIVNCASPDNSQSIMDEYLAKNGRIQCILCPPKPRPRRHAQHRATTYQNQQTEKMKH